MFSSIFFYFPNIVNGMITVNAILKCCYRCVNNMDKVLASWQYLTEQHLKTRVFWCPEFSNAKVFSLSHIQN